jgi:abhydrolase domain-containing protein 14
VAKRAGAGHRRTIGTVTVAIVIAAAVATTLAGCSSDDGPVAGERTMHVGGADVHAIVRLPKGTRTPAYTALFLHGAAYNSRIWARRGILDAVTKAGWRAVAVDLPGHGATKGGPGENASTEDRAAFIAALVQRYGGGQSVAIVSPSMSGRYSVPYLQENPIRAVRGFVPIAPSGIDDLERPPGATDVPTLSVFGADDPLVDSGLPDRIERQLPGTETEVIPGASHAAYDDHPREFIALLVPFLRGLMEIG